jgi:histidinol dehydrogenase
MKIIRHTDPDFSEQVRTLTASSSLFDPEIERRTRAIIEAVQQQGDEALIELTERFDGQRYFPEQFSVTKAELVGASLHADQDLRAALHTARRNIEMFARRSLRKNWMARNSQGAVVGEKFDPFQRVGVYIPGGTAPLVSTALMTVVLARAAGCPEIIVCTPAGRTGVINPALLFAVNSAGATEIYRLGGAQAIAAMAFGTRVIPRVQKVFGPGNAYVVAAKRLLCGYVAVDLLPGPSEVLILADDTAEPRFIAADLLAQAEHGSGHERVWLVTTSAALLRQVEGEILRQLPARQRREMIERVLNTNTWLIQVKRIEDGVHLANALAPEHCEVYTRHATRLSTGILTAGAIFLGPYSPTVLGDYVAGPSHVLPTGGAGASFAGLTVDQFQRRTSIVEYSPAALKKSLAVVQKFAAVEGLDGHGRSAEIRLEKSPKRAVRGPMPSSVRSGSKRRSGLPA